MDINPNTVIGWIFATILLVILIVVLFAVLDRV